MNSELCITPQKVSMMNTPTSRCLQPSQTQNIIGQPTTDGVGFSDNMMMMGTPNTRAGNPNFARRSLVTPSKIFNKKSGTFNLLPVINTPPSRRFPRVINPFDAALTERLHLPMICSPLFRQSPQNKSLINTSVTDSSANKSGTIFEWTIDDVSSLSAANVVPCETQFQQITDPELEAKAQAAISSFFKEQQIVPSPVHCPLRYQKIDLTGIVMGEDWSNVSNNFSMEKRRNEVNMSYSEEVSISKANFKHVNKKKRDNCSQTVLSLPPILPVDLEEKLAAYFTYNDDQQQSSTSMTKIEANTTADYEARDASLRRKLFSQSYHSIASCDTEDFTENDELHMSSFSPPPRSPELDSVATFNEKAECSLSQPHRDLSVSPIKRESFGQLSPISKTLSPVCKSYKQRRCGSDTSIELFRSTPERLVRSASYLMETSSGNRSFADHLSCDDLQFSQNSSQHPPTPLRSQRRSANRKNLSRSFSLFCDTEIESQLCTDLESKKDLKEIVVTVSETMKLERMDSGFNEGASTAAVNHNCDDKSVASTMISIMNQKGHLMNLISDDVSMRSETGMSICNDSLISSTPSKRLFI